MYKYKFMLDYDDVSLIYEALRFFSGPLKEECDKIDPNLFEGSVCSYLLKKFGEWLDTHE